VSKEHRTAAETAKNFESRLREHAPKMERSEARRIAEQAARDMHTKLDKGR
jgi:hypothetical protein